MVYIAQNILALLPFIIIMFCIFEAKSPNYPCFPIFRKIGKSLPGIREAKNYGKSQDSGNGKSRDGSTIWNCC